MEQKTDRKVFIKQNQVWQKASVVSETDNQLSVQTKSGIQFEVDKNSPLFEELTTPGQKFAMADVKANVEGAYISFEKLPENIQQRLAEGKEYLYEGSFMKEGKLVEASPKMIQMVYNYQKGSTLSTQIKRAKEVEVGEAKAYNHEFSKDELQKMKEGKHILFQGVTNDGLVFDKIAYYEPKLNDVRTKPVLTENTYFYGKKLTDKQAAVLNNGGETEITIDTKDGKKTYQVGFNAKSESFSAKNLDKEKSKNIEVKSEKVQSNPKKKSEQKSAGINM